MSLLCRSSGIMRGLAKGAKRAGGRFSGGIDLLTCGEVVAIVKPGRELSTLTDWSLQRTWRSLRIDLAANQVAYYMADLVQRLLAAGDPHPSVFDAIIEGLDAIESGRSPHLAALTFQWMLLEDLGYRPRLDLDDGAPVTVSFIADTGSFSVAPGNGGWKVRRSTVEFLVRTAELVDAHRQGGRGREASAMFAHLDAAPKDSVARGNRLLAAYLRHIVGAPLGTMRALFPEL